MMRVFCACATVYVLIVCTLLNVVNGDIRNGTCGENLTWTLDVEGTLRISGNGNMTDYEYKQEAPWCDQQSLIKSVEIENGVTSIGSNAFYKLTSLTSVSISSTVEIIGFWAFYSCTSLLAVSIPDSVTLIKESAFYSCVNLTSVIIGNSVKTFLFRAFSGCSSLKNLVIGNSVETIGVSAFYGCSSLNNVIIPNSVKIIENCAFQQSGLTSVVVPDSVVTIGDYAFNGCSNLTSVVIGNGVTSIGEHSFRFCKQLVHLTLGNSLSFIDIFAFDSCESLTDIIFPDSLKTVKHDAFSGCKSLTYVVIPESVRVIESRAFASCSKIKSVFFQGSNISADSNSFPDCYNVSLVCVPPDLNVSEFGGKSVNSYSSGPCHTYEAMFNHCFIGSYANGEITSQKRKNATEWESQSDGCVAYECDDDTGRTKRIICISSDETNHICVEGECTDESQQKEKSKWMVDVELNGDVDVDELDVAKVKNDLHEMTGEDMEGVKIGYEIDNNGEVLRVMLFLDDENTAIVIASSLNDLIEEETCERGILCRIKTARAVALALDWNALSKAHHLMINLMMLLLCFVLLFI